MERQGRALQSWDSDLRKGLWSVRTGSGLVWFRPRSRGHQPDVAAGLSKGPGVGVGGWGDAAEAEKGPGCCRFSQPEAGQREKK